MLIYSLFNIRVLSIGLLCALLIGCSSSNNKEENLAMLVNQRAAEITSGLPVQKDNYSLVMARPLQPATLELVVYSDTNNEQESDALFLQRFTQALCSNAKSRALLQYGAKYQIRLRHGNNQENIRVIQYESCPRV